MPDGIMLWNMSDGLSNPFLPDEAGLPAGGWGGVGGCMSGALTAASRPANVLQECFLDAGTQLATPLILLLMIPKTTEMTNPV